MEYLVTAIWLCIEMAAQYFVLKIFLRQRVSDYSAFAVMLLQGMTIFAFTALDANVLNLNTYLAISIKILISVIASVFIFSGSFFPRIIAICIQYFALASMDTIVLYGVASALKVPVSALVWKKLLYTVVCTSGKLVFLFLAWFVSYIRSKSYRHGMIPKHFALISLFPVMSIFALYTVFESSKNQNDLSFDALVFSVILAVSNVLVIYLLTSIERAAAAEQELAILNQSMALQTENICALEKNYRAQRAATHDFKNQLQVIYELLDRGENAAAKDYVQQLQVTQTSRIFAANTKHPIVDAILNEKYHAAKERNIDISYKVNDLSQLSIGTNAIVVLLSNLLDNAIEACERFTGERIIECTILLEDKLFISVRNTSSPVAIHNGKIKTSKKPENEHGFGLPGVERVISELKGEYAIEYSNNWFQFAADIPVFEIEN